MTDPLSLAHPGKNTPFGRTPHSDQEVAGKCDRRIQCIWIVFSYFPRFRGLYQAYTITILGGRQTSQDPDLNMFFKSIHNFVIPCQSQTFFPST